MIRLVSEEDPYAREENYLRTDGRDVCHWCSLRPHEWVWAPYGTRVCDHCQQMAAEGRAHDIVEEIHARMIVRGNFDRGIGRLLDPETWRIHELARIDRWMEVRTDCHAIEGTE